MKNKLKTNQKFVSLTRYLFLTMAFLLLPVAYTYAQQKTIKGTVLDEQNAAVIGASVNVKGTSVGTITDLDGVFSIQAKPTDILEVAYVGYVRQSIPISGKSDIKVILKEDNKLLDEVVVVGYGTVKKANVVGSIARIDESAIADRPITRVEQALQGQMAGVSVRSTSGSPGGDITINVRGAASINGESSPLYVVDGVPIDNLSGINPNDIQSIEVLKDAASAAIYGSRGSNGVVLVTTKRGKKGKAIISLSAYTGIANVEKTVDVMNSGEWIAFNKKWLDRQWTNKTGQSVSVSQAERIAFASKQSGKTYDNRTALNDIRASYGIYDPYWGTDNLETIDWQDAIFKSAPISDIQLNAAGATENVVYSISTGVLQQEGIVAGSAFDRYSLRANFDVKMNDRMKLTVNIAPSYALKKGANVDGKDAAVARALSFPGIVPAGAGRMAGADPYKFYDLWGPGPNNVSPYVQAVYNDRRTEDVRVNSAANMTVNIIDGLSVNGLVSWNFRSNMWRTYSPTWIQGTWDTAKPGEKSSSRKASSLTHSLMGQAMINYVKEFGNHSLAAMLALSEEKNTTESSDQGLSGFANDKTWVFDKNSGTTVNYNTIDYGQDALISYFGRIQYGYKDRYLVTTSLRKDGSSKFGSNSRWGWFPSVSGAWKVNEEDFMKKFEWLGTAKLRASWGLAGNDRIGSAAFLSNMVSANYVFGDDQAIQNGFVVGNISNSFLGWEKTDSYNFGLDLGFFKNRIYMQADVYYKKTTDLLLKAPTSLTTGYSSMMDNVGNVENRGFEFELNTVNLTGQFQWNSSFNMSINRNKITSLGSNDGDIKLGQGNTIIQRVGQAINSYYLLKATGVLRAADFESDGVTPKKGIAIYSGQKPGDTKYFDATDDGKITSDDYIVAGKYEPDFEWGLMNTFKYKNFDMSVLLQGRVGGDLLSIGSRGWNRATNDPKYNYMDQWLYDAYWSEEEPGNGKVPAFFSAVTSQYDTNWMYDAGYIRIKNITLGYDIPVKKVLNKARVYFSCDNVYMWDNYYPGFSPEAATQDNASSDWGSYPLARTFTVGVNITF
ncbi:TonB-linked SusC/RagA family outer membrane protein [Dysgonomonas alginatilytica]|uniref:TonB-linked SusC/RagA family outer membrane protein n=1 Tax=Dysgonomonas alginatilytica TaxID=1605892 RepID=A0A2V3PQ71_9BACT|nr:TonB-dependent receptor [Dysgonomonas alginatilytica]PXV65879.1 TonB-linked SusC/RagA family outer membrane protein [Dysgonomonas alginatilytica]